MVPALVAIACSQALLPYFLPRQIAEYRSEHPQVTFGVHLRDRADAEATLVDHAADLAIVFEPLRMADFHALLRVPQPVYAVVGKQHPLADRTMLRLGECLSHSVALATRHYGVRHLLEVAVQGTAMRLEPAVESDSFEFLRHSVLAESMLTFQIPIGLPEDDDRHGTRRIPLNPRDVPTGVLYMGQLKGRVLPVAAARFAGQLSSALAGRYEVS